MAFEGLTEKLNGVFKKLRSRGRLSESDVREAMREVKLALLEADVNFKVVRQFVNTVTEKAVGSDILEGLNPGERVVVEGIQKVRPGMAVAPQAFAETAAKPDVKPVEKTQPPPKPAEPAKAEKR